MTPRSSIVRFPIDIVRVAALAVATLSVTGPASGQGTGAAKVRILEPADGVYVSGAVRLRAVVEPADAASEVVFFADGRQICAVARAPYECAWDAGPKIVEHQIRVVANLIGGGVRPVATVRTKAIAFAESVEVDVVQITATVTDGHGHFVKDLPKSVFHVFEDGARQTISHFSGDDSPLELVVAIDTSNSMAPWVAQVKAAVSEFLAAIPTQERVTLLAFNSSIATLATQTTSLTERSSAVEQLTASGTTVLYDTIIRGSRSFSRMNNA